MGNQLPLTPRDPASEASQLPHPQGCSFLMPLHLGLGCSPGIRLLFTQQEARRLADNT